MCLGNKKLVVLGIPWEVDTEGLRQYMSQFGELADVMVMKDRASGRSRGFGYVTFLSLEDAEKALAAKHIVNGRTLDVKVATPKEEMVPVSKKSSRIFVARIPLSVTDEDFRSYFMKYGPIIDAYMPKEPVMKQHRGIGFVTYESSDSVDQLMPMSHELGGSTVAIDRATPKEDSRAYRLSSRYVKVPYTYNTSKSLRHNSINGSDKLVGNIHQVNKDLQTNATSTREGPTVDQKEAHCAAAAPAKLPKKLFIGRIPVETTSEDLQAYFSQFGWVADVYLPRDAKKTSHRGFGFVTFADEASAARVSRLRHYIHGREIAIDSASPSDSRHGNGQFNLNAQLSSVDEEDGHSGVAGISTGDDNLVARSTGQTVKWGKRLFVGRIPIEATPIDLSLHFSQFGNVVDVYLPKDDKRMSHRGFGFVTFADEISAEYASQKFHKILGQKVVLDRAAPLENEGLDTVPSSSMDTENVPIYQAVSALKNLSSSQVNDLKLIEPQNASVIRPPRMGPRYRPY